VLGKVSTPAAKELAFPFFGWEFSLDQNGFWFFPLLLLVAFIGGMLLNFTPCVLPIIPLKIMGLSAAASGERKRTFMLGLAMSWGVVGFWLLLGGLLSFIKGFDHISAFFQYPAFTISVGVFIAIMAVGMAGFFNIGLPQWVYAIEPKHETYGGSVIFGVMTAILSTPCTAPLMGAAAGWAVTTKQPSTVLAVFLAIGAGMAFPYLVLSAFPQLARKMPKTGPASDVLKQVMGLLLLAAAAYFVGAGLNSFLEEPSKVYWWVVSAVGVVAGAWLLIRTLQLAKTVHNRVIYVTVGLLIAVPSGMIGPAMTYEPLPWQRFTPQALVDAGKAGNVTVIDFTAEWCINCKVLKKTVLESSSVAPVLTEDDVVLLKADTGVNQLAQAKLSAIGRSSIPFLQVVAPNGDVVFESDAYTQQQVVDAVRKAQGKSVASAQGAPSAR
jgi:thiol:disulfide interchange protein DsbD